MLTGQMDHPDVIVVGAGLAGCSVAWHLASTHRVLVLDQGDQPGAEASAQNAGMVRRLGHDPCERALALRSFSFFEAPGDDWSEAPPSRTVGAVLALASDPTQLHDAVAHLRVRGVPVHACDRPAEVAPALSGSRLSTAWYLPQERVADPHALLTGFLRGIRRCGSAVQCKTAVEALVLDGDRVVGVRTPQGELHAPVVVLAAGAWSAVLARRAGLVRPLVPLRRTLIQTAPDELSNPDHPWCWIDDVGLYVRPEAGGWLLSGCDESIDGPPAGPGSWGQPSPYHRALAMDKLGRHLPALAEVQPVGGWTGLRTFATDRRPVLGEDLERPGLWWAAGLGGFGVTCAYAVGEAVAAWMRGHRVDWLRPSLVSPSRRYLRRWPIHPDGTHHGSRLVEAP
jgi:D-arginine dehydrogenase